MPVTETVVVPSTLSVALAVGGVKVLPWVIVIVVVSPAITITGGVVSTGVFGIVTGVTVLGVVFPPPPHADKPAHTHKIINGLISIAMSMYLV